MIRTLLRLTMTAILSTMFFSLLSMAFGYLAIDVLGWHGTKLIKSELATLEVGILMTAPIFLGLALLGMLLAWRDARSLSALRLSLLASVCPVVLSLIFTLEDIPRDSASWLGFLLPVVVVVVYYWAIRLLARREVARHDGPAPFRWTVYRLSFLTSSSCTLHSKRSLPPQAADALV
jgi:hypothetical protein